MEDVTDEPEDKGEEDPPGPGIPVEDAEVGYWQWRKEALKKREMRWQK